jgi:hypothetical protein
MKRPDDITIKPGIYPLSVEDEKIRFRVGSRVYLIYHDHLMKNGSAPFDCLEELSAGGRIFPLKQYPSNRFTLGKYADTEIIINFNHVRIIRRPT